MKALALAVLVLQLATAVVARDFLAPLIDEVPVERVVTNLERVARDNPKDPEVQLNLARVHAMAYAQKAGRVRVNRGEEGKGLAIDPYEFNHQPAVKATKNEAQLATANRHLAQAIARYEEAIRLAPENALARLGLGWALEQSGDKVKAIDVYRETLRLAWPGDLMPKGILWMGRTITEEAARYLIPLLDPANDKDEIATLRERVSTIGKMSRAVSPIAIPLRDGLDARDIVSSSARVLFDLDGSGLRKPWTWITPDAAWLVMDLHGHKQIRSGLQMFGNVTFWLFWENGYRAMRALDDDGDGRLRGKELEGLALWHDRNSDGVSAPTEVRPLSAWNIVELSCDYRIDPTHPDEIAWSPKGVRFTDGRVRPTFDVVLHANASVRSVNNQ
jgi:tetratricopeptide (TPR) repeat protein